MAVTSQTRPEFRVDDAGDEKMEQVRNLLFGEYQRRTDARLAALEQRVREMEAMLERRLDAIDARLEGLSGEIDANQRSALEEIARGMQDLGDRVRRIRGN